MALPWIIGAAAVATVAYLASDDDSSSSSSSDRYDRGREAKEREKEKKNERIHDEIREYKDTQLSQIEEKYGVIIDFVSEKYIESSQHLEGLNSFFEEFKRDEKSKVLILNQDKTIESKINHLQKDSKLLKNAMQELEKIKNSNLK